MFIFDRTLYHSFEIGDKPFDGFFFKQLRTVLEKTYQPFSASFLNTFQVEIELGCFTLLFIKCHFEIKLTGYRHIHILQYKHGIE